MAQQFSFDIVSEVNFQEVDNAVNQAKRELQNRYDFKGSKSSITFRKEDKMIELVADDDLKLKNLQDILKTRLAARKVSLKSLEYKDPEQAFEGTLRQGISLIHGLPSDKAKSIVSCIKGLKVKAQPSIQGEQVRVSSKSKDELQTVMQALRTEDFGLPLAYTNYR